MGPQGPAGNDGLDGATGPMGPQGPQGPTGLAGIEYVTEVIDVLESANTTDYALCSGTKKVLGGGFILPPGNGVKTMQSVPTATGDGWTVEINDDGTDTLPRTFTIYAICANLAE